MAEPDHKAANDLRQEAAALRESGRFDAAEACLLRALGLEHDCAAAHLELALVYLAQERLEDAVDYLELAVHFAPQSAAAWTQLGAALHGLKRTDAAIEAYRRASALEPRSAGLWLALGGLYKAQDDWMAAIVCYRTAAECDPQSADALCLLGYALFKAGLYADSRDRFEAALRLVPSMLQAHHNLGLVFLETAAPDRALECFERALTIDSSRIESRAGRAHALRDLGRLEEAVAHYDEILAVEPLFADAVINRSYALLMQGRYAQGWAAYDERFASGGEVGRDFHRPPWKGEPPGGRRILVYAEQGLGDEIMFASCIPDLAARGAQCIVECNTRLARLFARSFPQATVHGGTKRDDASWLKRLPAPDFQVSMGSLPRFFRASAADFPARSAYLRADPASVDRWRAGLAPGPAMRIGIAWRGGSLRSRQFARSIPLSLWTPVLSDNRAAFYSLQYGETAGELAALRASHGIAVTDFGTALDDVDELAALIIALDLVITVDNTIAHLAGALGRPVWVLLPASPEWRYPRSGETMPWYPSMRLKHRALHETWDCVLERVASALRQTAP